jgi:hypothetical protein
MIIKSGDTVAEERVPCGETNEVGGQRTTVHTNKNGQGTTDRLRKDEL